MAATFSFSTTPVASGHTVRIYNTSLNWDEYVPASSSGVTLTITALDSDAIFEDAATSFVKTYTPNDLVGDFILNITSLEMFGVDKVIPDDILTVKIEISGSVEYEYSTDEVFYYNAWKLKSEICYNAVNFIADINSLELKYACMINALYQGLIADIAVANTSGIYEKFNIFNRLSV